MNTRTQKRIALSREMGSTVCVHTYDPGYESHLVLARWLLMTFILYLTMVLTAHREHTVSLDELRRTVCSPHFPSLGTILVIFLSL